MSPLDVFAFVVLYGFATGIATILTALPDYLPKSWPLWRTAATIAVMPIVVLPVLLVALTIRLLQPTHRGTSDD